MSPRTIATFSGRPHRIGFVVAATLLWCGLTTAVWARLYSYTYQPEQTQLVVREWPRDAGFDLPQGNFRIVLFVHPLCPCTRATLEELDESLARMPREVSVCAVAVTCGLAEEDVAASFLIAHLRQMPRVELHLDPDGAICRRFGGSVSGEVFAFDAHGRCVYHGGLTTGRGHQGDSAGQRRLEQLAAEQRPAAHGDSPPCEAPVFGCRLPSFRDHIPPSHLPARAP